MSERTVGVLLYKLIDRLGPPDPPDPRHAFQLRFFLGACLLALSVAVLSIPVAVATEPKGVTFSIIVFAMMLLAQITASRLGVSVRYLAWTLLATVTLFLVIICLSPDTLDPAQLPWLILIPLSARAFTAPRIEDSDPTPTAPMTLAGAALAILALAAIVVLQHLGITFGRAPGIAQSWAIAANFLLFLMSVLGLVSLYDFSAQVTIAELQRVRQLLAICAWCRKINSDDEWLTLERYTTLHTNNDLTHGICPACSEAEISRLKARLG